MPNLLGRSLVRDSLVLVTAACAVMTLFGQGSRGGFCAAAITGSTIGMEFVRRLRGRSVIVTTLGSALGAATVLAAIGFVVSLPPPAPGVRHKFGHGPMAGLFVGYLLFLMG